ncbi:hypothetical protein ACTSKR_03690 [Chitinibacteraceae bacterium HSL-7]
MKPPRHSLLGTLIAGILVVAPVYLALLLLLKALQSMVGLVKPLALLLPDWLPAEQLVALLLLLALCLATGFAIRTASGRAMRDRLERKLFSRLPGYALLRSLTQRMAGDDGHGLNQAWQPALVELERALVPAFIIEAHDDGQITVFVPSVPTPFAGAVYVMEGARVHAVDMPFSEAIKVISRWGQGAGDMVKAMKPAAPR